MPVVEEEVEVEASTRLILARAGRLSEDLSRRRVRGVESMQSPPFDGVLVDRVNVSAEPGSPATSAGPVDPANYCSPHVHDGPRITWTNMNVDRLRKLLTPHAQAADPTSLNPQVGGGDGLLPVWTTGPTSSSHLISPLPSTSPSTDCTVRSRESGHELRGRRAAPDIDPERVRQHGPARQRSRAPLGGHAAAVLRGGGPGLRTRPRAPVARSSHRRHRCRRPITGHGPPPRRRACRCRGWTQDPFGADIVDGFVYGRGAVDMLNIVAACAHAIRPYIRGELRPRGDLVFAAVADEEAGGMKGSYRLTKEQWHLVGADFMLSEVAYPRVDTSQAVPVSIGEKGSFFVRLKTTGIPPTVPRRTAPTTPSSSWSTPCTTC